MYLCPNFRNQSQISQPQSHMHADINILCSNVTPEAMFFPTAAVSMCFVLEAIAGMVVLGTADWVPVWVADSRLYCRTPNDDDGDDGGEPSGIDDVQLVSSCECSRVCLVDRTEEGRISGDGAQEKYVRQTPTNPRPTRLHLPRRTQAPPAPSSRASRTPLGLIDRSALP